MSDDPFDDPAWKEYARHAREVLEPMVADSNVGVSIFTGTVDPKMAIETGYMILLDKPIIAVVAPGAKIPRKFAAVIDAVVEGEVDDPTLPQRISAAIDRVCRGRD